MQSTLIALSAGVITQLLIFAFTFGRFTERIKEHDEQLDDHEGRIRFVEKNCKVC